MPMSSVENVMSLIAAEVEKATAKFPTWPNDPLHALAVLGEEFGELTKDMLQLTYEPHKTSAENVRKEAIQTAAMAVRLLMSLDRYEYRRGQQHSQGKRPGPFDHAALAKRERWKE
jgi:NTP pyrophosphatase (non-canonical NTP hydrolase)